ncbi:hypothetical protein TSAR_010934 [Trichomalopsis sarcophagae]|uniref:Uncharacterized protein n=1 Tax=Trichomalopsis sarcophagae TaxID=543379 RepID=A0A232ED62_9HYME|nr:hypothetical protein TSAR_010934 [Trichomalopsis sarcophagae]
MNISAVTKFMIIKLLQVTTDSLSYHLGKYSELQRNIQCECGVMITPTSMGSFFIQIDIIDKLKKLFSNPFTNNLDERFNRKKTKSENLEDIYDGAHYKEQSILFESKWNLSYTFNTDGCQTADKGKFSAWPIFLIRKKFMIIQGLWVAKVEPKFNIFLQPFVDQANLLSSKGFEWIKNNVKIISKVLPLACCVD